MAVAALLRSRHLFSPPPFSLSSSSSSLLKRLFFTSIDSSPFKLTTVTPNSTFSNPTIFIIPNFPNHPTKPFTTTPESNPTTPPINTKVNFTPPDSESDSEPETEPTQKEDRELPPPYDPFNEKSAIGDPKDPKNLQEVFHKMRSEGLMSNAAKMFDEMCKDGLTHEALELFREIKDKEKIPDVVVHTAVMEAYAEAGQSKEAHNVFLRMLGCGVLPNAYTYSVLIKSLCLDADGRKKSLGDVEKYVLEMLGKGMRPNARVCCVVFEAFAKEGMVEEGKELYGVMKEMGFVVDDKGVREVLKGNRGHVYRVVMDILFGK